MFHDPQTSRAQISKRLQQLATEGGALYERAERGEPMGPRELARAIELNQQYVELLEELETMDFGICESASVEVIL
jgi:hypothetical protein